MLKKKIKSVVMTSAILCSAGMVTTAMAAAAVPQDDLLQDMPVAGCKSSVRAV